MARISLSELRTRASTVDQAKVDATMEAEIHAQRAADPDAPAEMPADAHIVEPPKALRVRLGMTQPEMAAALGIPVGTWRNWEQGRVRLDPTANALLRIVSREPAVALAALATSGSEPAIVATRQPAIEDLSQRLAELVDIQSTSRAPSRAALAADLADDLLRLVTGEKPTAHG